MDTVSASFLQLLQQYFASNHYGTHLTQNLYQHQFCVVSSDPAEYLTELLNVKDAMFILVDSKLIKATNELAHSNTTNYVLKAP